MPTIAQLGDMASILRRDSLKMTTKAGSGHPTTCLSCAEIMSVLFFNEMGYDVSNAGNPDNDEFLLSKGHGAPILYSALYRAGCTKTDLMSLRKYGSPFEGHPLPGTFPWIKVGTGSLGQGLSIGVGMAIAGKLQKRKYRTYVLMGDSEMAEGSVYEAFELGAHYKLSNLCAIVDVNRLGQRGETMLGHDIDAYKGRLVGFGWNVITVDGHEVKQLVSALGKARKETKKPTVIVAKTFKGKGVSFLENKEGWHGKAVSKDQIEQALKELPNPSVPKINIKKPAKSRGVLSRKQTSLKTKYKLGEEVATRDAYGNALAKLAKVNPAIVATDGEVSNSTKTEKILETRPEHYVEAYIAEQNMVGMALGMSKKGFDVFASSFACFLSRAHDQLRMAALSSANMTVVGSHAGVSIGEDGPSQMGLEDIAIFRCLPGSIVLYPGDAVAAEKLTELAVKTEGLKYIRTNRPKTPVLYKNGDKFPLGEFKVLKQSSKDKAVIVGAGVTVNEALKAYEKLKKKGINAAVVDCYCIKPFSARRFRKLAEGKKVIVVEDHYAEGGIGEMISGTGVEVHSLAVHKIPHSGKPEDLMQYQGIDAGAITNAVLSLVR